MTDRSAPALTPDEWEWLSEPMDAAPLAVSRGTAKLDTALFALGPMIATGDYSGRRHVLAALALHGQPFGFTRADLDLLTACALLVPSRGEFLKLDHLAARIAALLPPEPK